MPGQSSEIITSRQNPLIMRTSKLSDKKYRDAEGLFRIDGVKLFREAVASGIEIEYVFIAAPRLERMKSELSDELERVGGRIVTVSDEVLSKLTDEKAPQGIVASARKFGVEPEDAPPDGDFRALLLSSIRDPGNLGTMIRTAYAFGVDRVYLSGDCADIYSPKTLRAAMGTIFRQPISIVGDEIGLVRRLKAGSCAVMAAALREDAVRLGGFDMPGRICFAVGNEGHGLSDELIDACTGRVIIPMNPGCESLNAAGAAGILCWEMCRGSLIAGHASQ